MVIGNEESKAKIKKELLENPLPLSGKPFKEVDNEKFQLQDLLTPV